MIIKSIRDGTTRPLNKARGGQEGGSLNSFLHNQTGILNTRTLSFKLFSCNKKKYNKKRQWFPPFLIKGYDKRVENAWFDVH